MAKIKRGKYACTCHDNYEYKEKMIELQYIPIIKPLFERVLSITNIRHQSTEYMVI